MSGRCWRRLAVSAARHAARVLPGANAPWADAMRRELDYIADDRAALRWAVGCVAASYLAWLAALPRLGRRMVSAPVAAGSVLLVVGLAMQGHASDDPVPAKAACERADAAPDVARAPVATAGVPARPEQSQRPSADDCQRAPADTGAAAPPIR